MAVISCNGEDLVGGFYMPFKESANYLGMNYLGNVHTQLDEDRENIAKKCTKNIEKFLALIP